MRVLWFVIIIILTLGTYLFYQNYQMKQKREAIPKNGITYVSLGDSYTIGEGVKERERYPNQLVSRLKDEGFMIYFVANPAVAGRTLADVIARQVPVVEQTKPSFVTLLIGANDIVQGRSAEIFRRDFSTLLDRLISLVPNKQIIVLTIPDFSATPAGNSLSRGVLVETIIVQFNTNIKKEALLRGIAVVDVFEMSKKMSTDPSLVLPDGLHPSAKAYKEWTDLLYPTAYKVLTQQ